MFTILFAVFAFLHLFRPGAVGLTWDEGTDVAIVKCIAETHDPFVCTDDISQTRLPFYIHLLLGHDYLISFAFSALTLVITWLYLRRERGELAANLFAALYVTSPAMLASGRMLLTHSHIICTAFSTLSFLALFEYNRTGKRRYFYACAILSGLAAASSVVGVFNGVVLLAFYTRRAWRDLVFFPIAMVTFFATTIIYVQPDLLSFFLYTITRSGVYSHWNYLGLGAKSAPWFFPFVLLVVKTGIWFVPAVLASHRFGGALLIILVLKGMLFGYETPHHQMQFYPLLFLFAAVGIASAWRRWVMTTVLILLAVQAWDVARFFPHYLFYGSQYGERMLGEFYGPAVIHGQGREAVWKEIDAILAREPNARFLVADHNIFERRGPNFVKFSERTPDCCEYALVDRLHASHLNMPGRDAYNAHLAAHYEPVFTTTWPPGVWVYRILRRR